MKLSQFFKKITLYWQRGDHMPPTCPKTLKLATWGLHAAHVPFVLLIWNTICMCIMELWWVSMDIDRICKACGRTPFALLRHPCEQRLSRSFIKLSSSSSASLFYCKRKIIAALMFNSNSDSRGRRHLCGVSNSWRSRMDVAPLQTAHADFPVRFYPIFCVFRLGYRFSCMKSGLFSWILHILTASSDRIFRSMKFENIANKGKLRC